VFDSGVGVLASGGLCEKNLFALRFIEMRKLVGLLISVYRLFSYVYRFPDLVVHSVVFSLSHFVHVFA